MDDKLKPLLKDSFWLHKTLFFIKGNRLMVGARLQPTNELLNFVISFQKSNETFVIILQNSYPKAELQWFLPFTSQTQLSMMMLAVVFRVQVMSNNWTHHWQELFIQFNFAELFFCNWCFWVLELSAVAAPTARHLFALWNIQARLQTFPQNDNNRDGAVKCEPCLWRFSCWICSTAAFDPQLRAWH